MNLMTFEEMAFYKKISGLSCIEISRKSGVPLSTVQKVFSKITATPRNNTLIKLRKAFEEFQKDRMFLCDPVYEAQLKKSISGQMITNGSNAMEISSYKDKTIDDYLALPNDARVELIDGVFYDMAAPNYLHQQIAFELAWLLKEYVRINKGKCSVSIAPTDVQLDKDDKTMIQPDVLITCDRSKITFPRIVGAPDFIAEILSESNWYNDVFRKREKYESAGVREYWIVMPKEKKILVYFFEKTIKPVEYSFDSVVPVNIWDGKCKINFKDIYEQLAYLMNETI